MESTRILGIDFKNRTFTLIELLIFIVIIAILASPLLLGFSRAKSVAHKAVYINNQRQIGIARQLYAGDNDRFLVTYHSAPHGLWYRTLCYGYLDGQTNLFDCPAEKRVSRLFSFDFSLFLKLGYLQNDLGLKHSLED